MVNALGCEPGEADSISVEQPISLIGITGGIMLNKESAVKESYYVVDTEDHQFTHDICVVARDVEDGVTYHYRVDNLAHLHLNGLI